MTISQVDDIKKFYQSVVTENDITEDTFKFFRTILNKLFDFAISELEIIQFNPIPSINTDIYKIRFTSASLLYDGSNLALLSTLLGHTTTRMTLHYFRNVLGEDEVKKVMSKLDQVVFDIA